MGLVIAVKRLDRGQDQAGAGVLGSATRESVVLAMLIDTITAASAVPAVRVDTVVTPDEVAAAAARSLGARVLADPTPRRPPQPAEQRHRRRRGRRCARRPRISLRCKVTCPPFNRRSWPRRSPPHGGTRAASSATGTAPGTSALFAFGVASTRSSALIRRERHRHSGAIELTGAWPGLRCDIDTPDDLMVARRLGVGAATTQAIGRPR